MYNFLDKSEEVRNYGKDYNTEWTEEWSKKGLERQCRKEGNSGAQSWKEQWYQKLKKLTKKKNTYGYELSDDDEDGSEIEESNCQKWGKNEENSEEWNEKWGEVHRIGEKLKWCDKW